MESALFLRCGTIPRTLPLIAVAVSSLDFHFFSWARTCTHKFTYLLHYAVALCQSIRSHCDVYRREYSRFKMYRTAESNHRSNNSMNDILNRTEEHDDVFNTSYNTAQSLASSANGSSSSKAVLAALRALQDKIRRLEAERSQALDETAQLRLQLKNQEIEADHMKQKENLNAQKSLHEVKSAYDRLLTEKTDMEVRLAKLEERNRSAQHVAEDLQAKIKALEDEKQSSLQRARDLEHQQQNYDLQIKNAQQKEKGEYCC